MASFTDDFNRADSTNLGADWKEIVGNWEISTNNLREGQGGTAERYVRCQSVLDTTDHYAEAVVAAHGVGDFATGVCVRCNDMGGSDSAATSTFYLFRYAEALGRWELYKRVSGTLTLLASFVDTVPVAPWTIRLQAVGSNIVGSCNGVPKISISDASIAGPGFVKGGLRDNLAIRYDSYTQGDLKAVGPLRPVADGTQTNIQRNSGETQSWRAVDDDPSAVDATDWIANSIGLDASCFMLLSDMPSDFVSMGYLAVDLHAVTFTRVDDTINLYAQVFEADEVTALTDEVLVGTEATFAAATMVTIGFSGVVGGTKSRWDGARIKLRWDHTTVVTADPLFALRVNAVELNGTYVPGVPLTTVGKEIGLLWNTRAAASNSISALWNVAAIAGEPVDLRWATRIPVGDQVSAPWRVTVVAGDSIALRWDDRALASDSAQLLWSVRAAAADIATLLWRTRLAVADQTQLVWNVSAGSIVMKTLGLQWKVQSSVTDQAVLAWNTRTVLQRTRSLQWGVRIVVADFIGLQWRTWGSVGDQLVAVWNVRALAGDTINVLWSFFVELPVFTGETLAGIDGSVKRAHVVGMHRSAVIGQSKVRAEFT